MSNIDAGLYFIAIIPSDPVKGDVQWWKEHFAATYQSKASLNSPAHITLHMPFKLKHRRVSLLVEALSLVGKQTEAFDLVMDGFDAFKPRIVFMKVLAEKRLNQLHENICQVMKRQFNIFNADYRGRPFHPHITLAFRDLKKDNFDLAWTEFQAKTYHEKITVDSFWLLKHDGKKWQPLHFFNLDHSY
jgi:2'-5' RNA ligase